MITMRVATDQINAITQPLRFSFWAADHIAPCTVKPTNSAAIKTNQRRAEMTVITMMHFDADRCASSHPKPWAQDRIPPNGGMTEK